MPESSGPGRKSALIATMSSKQVGLTRTVRSRMPLDSIWNTPTVSPRQRTL